ncbi:MAG: HIT family protein [Planctomycetes bacterium]|nr:HIT family protein [Planctomycetota bacterium]
MPSIFSKIIAGQIPCHKVAEDDKHFAFLDINPITDGHTLVVPKREVDYLFDLKAEEHAALWTFAHKVAALLKAKLQCRRVCVAVVGYEVPHAHIHLIPTNAISEFPTPPKLASNSKPALEAVLKKITG